ncbi:unnamed protein product, partial [Allacma fusca]
PLKVNEKGRKWLFGSRLFRREADGSWAPVWAFLFTDIIVLTSHMTRDRVFFVKETPIKLEDVVTLHFNLPRKNENEFRLLFGPEPAQSHYGRFDRILPIYRRPKSNQIILRTTNLQLKSMWKLLLQRQIITLNTRLSKSSSSNFSISEFCEKFPESNTASSRQEKIDEEPEEEDENLAGSITTAPNNKRSSATASSIAGIEARQVRSSNSATKDSINAGLLSKEPDQFKRLSSGPKLDNGLSDSSGQIISEQWRQSGHVSPRLEESGKDSMVNAALPSSPPVIVDRAATSTVGKGIIKNPQSRTVQVPENQQLVTDMRESQLKDGSANGLEETNVAIRANITSNVSTSPLATLSRPCETTKPDPTPLPTNNSHSDHHVIPTEASLTLSDSHVCDPMASSEIHPSATTTSSTMTKSTTSNDKNNYTSPNRKIPTLDLVPKSGEKRDGTLSGIGPVTNKTDISLPSSVGKKQGDKSSGNNGKFHQKPVEMLASPSEGSPSKSYLNSRKNSVRTETLINNNNESISDLNHNSSSDRRSSLKEVCECEGSVDRPLKEEASSRTVTPASESKEKPKVTEDTKSICISSSNNPNNNNDDESPVTMEKIRNFYTSILCTRDSSTDAGHSDHSKRSYTMISTSFTDTKPSSSSCDKTIPPPNSTLNNNATNSNTPNNTNNGKLTETELSGDPTTKETLPKADELPPSQIEFQGETNKTDPVCQSVSPQEKKGKVDDGDQIGRSSKAIENEIVCIESSSSPPSSSGGKIMRGDLPGPKIMTNAILKSRQQVLIMAGVSPTLSIVGDRECEKPPGGDQRTMGKKTVCKPIPLTTTKIGLVERESSNESIVAVVSPGVETTMKRNVIAPSKMELERHPDAGSNSCAKGKVYANSPIVSGIGSERSRRRLLYDYKVRRDYPELFGITPRDRRSFIKSLGEHESSSDKDLVAPYYYHTRLSPLPVLKLLQNGTRLPFLAKETDSDKEGSESTKGSDKCPEALPTTPCPLKPKVSTSASTNTPMNASLNTGGLHHMKLMGSLEDEDDDASTSTGSITHSKRNATSKLRDDEVEEEGEDDDSDVSASGTNRNHVRDLIERPDEVHLHRRRRSPEESSSNDSGISEEILIVTEGQTKTTSSVGTEVSEDLTLSTTESEVKRRFPSTLREHEVISSSTFNRCAVSSSSCPASTQPPTNNSPSVNVPKIHNVDDNSSCNTTSSSCSGHINLTENSIEATIVEPNTHSTSGIQQANPVLSSAQTKTAHVHSSQCSEVVDMSETSVSNSSTHSNPGTDCSTQSKMNHVCFVEGETTNGVDSMVELTKADKSTGMEDDDLMDFSWVCRLPEKAYRNLLAERREAFFLANNHSLSDSPSGYQHSSNYNQMNSNSPTLTTITSSSSHASSYSSASVPPPPPPPPPKEPLVVKIYDVCTVHNTIPPEPPSQSPSNACERVMYTRLEKHTTAHVERVESSDDSTSSSSDVASASPAAENGTTDPSWSSSSSSLAGYSSSMKEEPSPSTSATAHQQSMSKLVDPVPSGSTNSGATSGPPSSSVNNGFYQKGILVSSFLDNRSRPEIVVTGDSPDHPKNGYLLQSDDDEEEEQAISNSSIISNGRENQSGSSGRNEFLRVESNDSTAENYGDDDDYNFDDDDDELSHCSVATMNRYGTYESLEKIESDDTLGTLPDFPRNMPRSKARFTFDDDDDDDDDLFEEDFESDFNFRFPSQIQDNTYSVSRLGPLPPLLEEDYEDDMYEEHRAGSESPSNSTGEPSGSVPHLHNQVHQPGVRGDNSFLLARIATMYARSSISPLKIFRELWLKKRYRQWANTTNPNFKE